MGAWFTSPAGRYMLAWEQQRLDLAVADIFGFHALQLGLPPLDALRANRMPHRWLAADAGWLAPERPQAGGASVMLQCDFDALPFPAASLDLVVMPHTLEMARDPHRALAEVERVLMPEGRLVITGMNPSSLWGVRQRMGRLRRSIGVQRHRGLFLPETGDAIGYRRLRDWLRLLSFEVERGRFGCYRPALRNERWFERMAWMDDTGDRWWPVFGAVYFLLAVKRVRGMRLIGLARPERTKAQAAPAVIAQRRVPRVRGAQSRRGEES